jgi:hypothetical protein
MDNKLINHFCDTEDVKWINYILLEPGCYNSWQYTDVRLLMYNVMYAKLNSETKSFFVVDN